MQSLSSKGYFVLIGGAEDKQNEKAILKETVRLKNSQNVVVITTATSYPVEVYDTYMRAFRDIGVAQITHLDIGRRGDANDSKCYAPLNQADLVFFTGGNQERLVDIIGSTRLHQKLRKLHQKGITIAGTSAGAAALGNPMILGGDGNGGFQKGYVTILNGLGFLDGVVIDTHFLARCRIPRLVQVMSTGRARLGVGICEDTATILSPDQELSVVGSEAVVCLSSQSVEFSNFDAIRYDDKIAVDGMRLSILSPGSKFNFKTAKIVHSAA